MDCLLKIATVLKSSINLTSIEDDVLININGADFFSLEKEFNKELTLRLKDSIKMNKKEKQGDEICFGYLGETHYIKDIENFYLESFKKLIKFETPTAFKAVIFS